MLTWRIGLKSDPWSECDMDRNKGVVLLINKYVTRRKRERDHVA